MKTYCKKIKQSAFVFGLGACCLAGTSSAINTPLPELDCDNILVISRIHGNGHGKGIRQEGGIYYIPQHQEATYEHQISRIPKPRNEWIYDGTIYVEEIDDEWYSRDLVVDTAIKGRVERFYRGLMTFYHWEALGPGDEVEKEIPTSNKFYIVHVVEDPLPRGEGS